MKKTIFTLALFIAFTQLKAATLIPFASEGDTVKKKKIIIIKTEDDKKDISNDEMMKMEKRIEKFGNGKVRMSRDTVTDERIIVIENDDNGKKGDDTTIVKLGKMVFKMKPKNIEMGKEKECEADTTHHIHKPRAPKNIQNDFFGLDLGLCNFIQQPTSNAVFKSTPNRMFDLQQEKTFQVGLNVFQQRINLYQHHLNFRWGLGMSWETYRFTDNLRLYKDKNDGTLITKLDSSVNYTKNKFVNRYITLPLMLEARFGKPKTWKQFSVAGGVTISQYFGSWQKLISAERGTQKVHDGDFNLAPQRLSLTARVGLGKICFYGDYSLTPMFKGTQQSNHYMPELNPFNFGIRLAGM